MAKGFIALIQQYLRPIIGVLLALVIVFLGYRIFKTIGAKVNNVTDNLTDKAEIKIVSQATGITPERVLACKLIASDLARELETLIDMSFWDKTTNLASLSDVVAITDRLRTPNEMLVVKNFYNNNFTNGRNLLDDLKNEISISNVFVSLINPVGAVLVPKDLEKIKFISQLY